MSEHRIQWFNENEGRKYPLAEEGTLLDDTGQSLPVDIIADLGLLVPPAHADVILKSLVITPNLVTVAFASSTSALLVGTYAWDVTAPYVAYPLTAMADNVSGWIVFGSHLHTIVERYAFTSVAQTAVEQRAVHIVDALAVTRCVKYGARASDYVDQVVRLLEGSGINIAQDDTDPQKIVVSLDESVASSFISPCEDPANAQACGVPPIRSFLGVCPDEDGKIYLRFE